MGRPSHPNDALIDWTDRAIIAVILLILLSANGHRNQPVDMRRHPHVNQQITQVLKQRLKELYENQLSQKFPRGSRTRVNWS